MAMNRNENGRFNHLAGWWCVLTILKNDGVRQWGWDDIPYIMENMENNKCLKPPRK
jgi:hypothetical protein